MRAKERRSLYSGAIIRASKRDFVPLFILSPFPLIRGRGRKGDGVTK